MAKKERTVPFHIRLPVSQVARLDQLAKANFESRAGMAARLINEVLLRLPKKGGTK